jgi:hypothetical protein
MQVLKPFLNCVPGAAAFHRLASRTLACEADLRHRRSQPICSTGHATPRISPAPLVVSGLAHKISRHRRCAVTWYIEAGNIGSPPTSNAVPAPPVDLHSRPPDDYYGEGIAGSFYWVRDYYT